MEPSKDLPCAVVVIPTFNEAPNMPKLLKTLCLQVFPLIRDWQMKILVVDDSSPDGTGMIVQEMSTKFPSVHLLTQSQKCGIGAAYVRSFAYAVNELRADAVVEFDADFQHPPETIPALLAKISEGYDYVAGSRHIPGGSEPGGRNLFRKALTYCGGFLARIILFFPGRRFKEVTDPSTGLKATRVKGFIDHLDLDPSHLYSRSFGYKVQLLSETLILGARYTEIPLNFQNRSAGQSKFKASTIADILFACLRTRLHQIYIH